MSSAANAFVANQFAMGNGSAKCGGRNGLFRHVCWKSTQDETGAWLFDRCPRYFEPVLNYFRHRKLVVDPTLSLEGVLEEARFFGVSSLISLVEQRLQESESARANAEKAVSRREVIDVLMRSHVIKDELRFQGVCFAGADLSNLDLRHINFKYADLTDCNLSNANLSYSNMERANLSRAKLDGAQLFGVRMLCCVLEGASMKGCFFEDPAGHRAVMEGANLKNAVLEGSQMASVNLRVATLKNANLRNCDLRCAVLAGADLEDCDFTGSDLQECNLRGANFKGTSFELMITPLHMSQAI